MTLKTAIIGIVASVCAVYFAACNPSSSATTKDIKRQWHDLAYATTSKAQQLNIYLPNEGTAPFPVIIVIHGGAFMMGDKADGQLNPMLAGLKRGYAVVSVNYRLSGEAIFPAQIHDVKAAIRWIKANADKYQLNADKIATWGGSAGGNLSALCGTSGDVAALEDLKMGNPNRTSRIQASVDWFGPIDFLAMDAQFKASGKGKGDHSAADSPESKLMGQQITLVPELVKQMSPATYISADDPPFFIQHGTADHLIPTEQSIHFAEQLTAVLGKEKVTFIPLQGADHGGAQFDAAENVFKVLDFLDKYLK